MIGMRSGQPIGRVGGGAKALAFTAPDRHAQAFLAPAPLHGLAVHAPTGLAQLGVGAPVAPPGMRPAEAAQLVAERPVPVGLGRLVTLRAAMLPDQLARPPLGDAEHLLQVLDGAAPAGRADQFPRPSSFRASICSSLSATIRLSRAFSVSSCFSRLTSSAFMPPYCARQRW
jgi:hypothetical protein